MNDQVCFIAALSLYIGDQNAWIIVYSFKVQKTERFSDTRAIFYDSMLPTKYADSNFMVNKVWWNQ